jgi:DHA2 family lincomycin resistance protein-like MFS transporter
MASFVALTQQTPTWQILVAHVVLMISLAALFTPVFTMGLGSLPPHLYSHGSSLLGTLQQVAGASGTALVVTIMTSRALALTDAGVAPVAASLDGMRWAFAVSAALCVIVLLLVTRLPVRIEESPADETPDDLELLVDCVVGAPDPR